MSEPTPLAVNADAFTALPAPEWERWHRLLVRNVSSFRAICDSSDQALDFIEGFVAGRVGMVVPPDMIRPEEMDEAIRLGRELADRYGW